MSVELLPTLSSTVSTRILAR